MTDFSDQTTLLLRQASGSLALPAPAPLSERITAELAAIVTSVTGEMVAIPRATTQTLPAFARDISWPDVRWTDLPGDLLRWFRWLGAHVRSGAAALATPVSAAWGVTSLMALFQVIYILSAPTGPFIDEGIYVTAGLRTLQGLGVSDNYLTWFAGSLLWPVLAALAYLAGGLIGVRLLALLCTTLAVCATIQATRNLFGDRAALWTALALAVNGPLLALAHFGVYDQLSLLGLGVSFWAATELVRRDDRLWLVLAALAGAFAVLGKYPMILSLAPILALIWLLRGAKRRTDLLLFGYILAAVLIIYYLPLRDKLSQFPAWRVENSPSFGATPLTVAFSLAVYSAIPIALTVIGWLAAWPLRKRRLATILLGALFLWPGYHMLTQNSVGDTKHIVAGFIFAYPLIGLGLAHLWSWRGPMQLRLRLGVSPRWGRTAAMIIFACVALAGLLQSANLDRSWPDYRPVNAYLAAHVHAGDQLLVSSAWPVTMDLYARGDLTSPWEVYDEYRVQHSTQPLDLCRFDWFVDESPGYGWSDATRAQIEACGTFRQVYQTTTIVTNIGSQSDFVTYPVQITVWRNVLTETPSS